MTQKTKRNWLRDNGLTIVLLTFFLISFIGQLFSGFAAGNEERMEERIEALSLAAYFDSGVFLSSVFETGKASSCKCEPM